MTHIDPQVSEKTEKLVVERAGERLMKFRNTPPDEAILNNVYMLYIFMCSVIKYFKSFF